MRQRYTLLARPDSEGELVDRLLERFARRERAETVRIENVLALGTPRQQARFLAGITSPATSRAKLTRVPVFGSLAERRFADVLAWCEALVE